MSTIIYGQNYVEQMQVGDEMPIKKTLADKLERTGKQTRDLHNWGNVYEVKIGDVFCELIYSDRGGVTLRKGSNF